MPQLPPPVLLALIPSQSVHCDQYLQYSSLNFLSLVRVGTFPSPVRKIGVFLAVTAVRGPTRLDVELVGPNGNATPIFDWQLDPPLPIDPLAAHQVGGNVGAWFTDPGEYRFRALANGVMMGEWSIRVVA